MIQDNLPKKKCKKCGQFTTDYQCWFMICKDQNIYLCKECDDALNNHIKEFFKKTKEPDTGDLYPVKFMGEEKVKRIIAQQKARKEKEAR